MKQKFLLLSSCFLIFTGFTFAQQNAWTKYYGKNTENARERNNIPNSYQLVKLNMEQINQQLSNAPVGTQKANAGVNVKFPNVEGTFDTYKVVELSTMHPDLQAKYSEIKSYSGYKIDDPATQIRFSVSPYFGLNAVIRNTTSIKYIDSYSKDNQIYMMYDRENAEHTHTFECKHDNSDIYSIGADLGENTVIDGRLRTYRLAIATTIEYTAYTAQQAGVGSGTDAEKKAAVMEALNIVLTRLNEVYEHEVSVRFQLIANNDQIIFIHSDNYSVPNVNTMLGQNQTAIDGIIGNANYDIGHVFYQGGGGGVAYTPSVCSNNVKAGGVTGTTVPVGDPFVIDYVAHEMGHQFGANHTFNNYCDNNRNIGTSFEPGSGSTIMAYAGICSPNVQTRSDAYFHAASVREIYNRITGGGNCGAITETGNNEPTADAGLDRTIPKETPFVLTGLATDPDGDLLTYNWEQMDRYNTSTVQQMPPRPTNTGGPMFRSTWPTESPEKYFPRLSTIIAGYDPNVTTPPTNVRVWEKLPAVAREMNFSLLVRDNNPIGGQTGRDDIKLTVIADAGPFLVTSQNSAGIVWDLGSSQTITWDVANTNVAPVNTANVTILISTDGGLTFPHTLVDSTPNNGSYSFTVPAGLGTSTTARLMIKAIDNVFLNVNTTPFTINSTMGVDDVSKGDALAIYPNPSTGVFTIELESKANNISYSVYSLEGKLISQNNVNHNGGKFSQKLNLSHLPSGTYLIQVNNGAEKISKKLIIKK